MATTILTYLRPSWKKKLKLCHGEVFSPAEKEFFKHRMQTLYPKIGDNDVKTATILLAEQKAANCPEFTFTLQGCYITGMSK